MATIQLMSWERYEQYGASFFNALYVLNCLKMQPLSADQAADIDDLIHISALGSVASINNEPPSFLMHISQFVAGGHPGDNIAIHAELGRCPKWHNPAERLPQPKAIISIWGTLHSFNTYTPPSTNCSTTCVIVDTTELTYVYNPKCDPIEKAALPQKKKSKLQDRFKPWGRKPNSSSCPTTLPTPCSSQVTQGKRKEMSCEEEVMQGV
jgi:hypothetical protein